MTNDLSIYFKVFRKAEHFSRFDCSLCSEEYYLNHDSMIFFLIEFIKLSNIYFASVCLTLQSAVAGPFVRAAHIYYCLMSAYKVSVALLRGIVVLVSLPENSARSA